MQPAHGAVNFQAVNTATHFAVFIFQHPTTNTEHPTSSDSQSKAHWMLGVGCSMLDVSFQAVNAASQSFQTGS
jgi:hypothetical protein